MKHDKIEFKPISIEDRSTVQHYTLVGHSQICDLSFSNLYGWSERYRTRWAVVEDCLVISFKPAHRPHPAFLMPICDCSQAFVRAIERLRIYAREGGFPLVLMGIAPKCRERLEELYPNAFSYISDEGSQDYIYLRERLVSLAGRSLQSKRNHINKFEKLYPEWQYEPLSDANTAECLALARLWLSHTDSEDGQSDEYRMIERCLRDHTSLGLLGGVIRAEGKVIAFSFGAPINADTFGVHVEKADTAYEGAFTIINREFARHIPERYTYINREEDLGIEGLRKSKLSYKPEYLLVKDVAILSEVD